VYVKIQDFGFHPASVAVAPGTTVRFVNRDPAGHTATADDASWDTGLLFQNQYADVVFNASSTYDCDPHPFMRGEIIVSTGKR
jgi:plastocyanin